MFDVVDSDGPVSPGSIDPKPALIALAAVLASLFIPFPWAYGAVLACVIAYAAASRRWNHRKFKGSESWPQTQSTVEIVNVKEFRGRKVHYHLTELGYSYSVNGEYYSGYCRCRFRTEQEAWAFAERSRGKTVPVLYKPEAPDISLMSAPQLASAIL